jgi:hypothetical protein
MGIISILIIPILWVMVWFVVPTIDAITTPSTTTTTTIEHKTASTTIGTTLEIDPEGNVYENGIWIGRDE